MVGPNDGFTFLPASSFLRRNPDASAGAALCARPGLRKAVSSSRGCSVGALSLTATGENDLNRLQTALNSAIEAEDYAGAAQYRDLIKSKIGSGDAGATASMGGWEALQVPEWLADRAERLGFRLPAQVQRNSLESIMSLKDTVIRSPTGSGKTLAYLMPMLSLLSDDLLDDDIMLHLTRFGSKQTTRSTAVSKLVDGELAPTPLAVIVVPTRELGVQVSTLCYMLLGGSRNNPKISPERIPTQHQPGSRTNMFTYKGPRRVKVVGVWDDEALNTSMPVEDFGLDALKGAHILVTTPKYLRPISERGHVALGNARVVVLDEADECLSGEGADDTRSVFSKNFESRYALDGSPRVRIFAGASLEKEHLEAATAASLLEKPTTVGDSLSPASPDDIWDNGQRMPSSILHKYVVCNEEARALGTLARLIRNEITRCQERGLQPRIIVYAKDAATAVRVASPLQNSLWTGLGGDVDKGLWGLSVLLPSAEDTCKFAPDNTTLLTYESSLRVMEKFYFDQVGIVLSRPQTPDKAWLHT